MTSGVIVCSQCVDGELVDASSGDVTLAMIQDMGSLFCGASAGFVSLTMIKV